MSKKDQIQKKFVTLRMTGETLASWTNCVFRARDALTILTKQIPNFYEHDMKLLNKNITLKIGDYNDKKIKRANLCLVVSTHFLV